MNEIVIHMKQGLQVVLMFKKAMGLYYASLVM